MPGIVRALLLLTLFVPAVVLLVPLYIEIVNPPLIDRSFVDSYWAIWLPAGASALNVILVDRFFNNLPREVFEAARVDGAGPFRMFTSIALPMSKPILAVVSVFAVLASWKDFLWPLLVLSNPDKQPLSVRLPIIQSQTELGVFLAAMFIACLVPIVGFLIFHRAFLRGTGLGRCGQRLTCSRPSNPLDRRCSRLRSGGIVQALKRVANCVRSNRRVVNFETCVSRIRRRAIRADARVCPRRARARVPARPGPDARFQRR